MKSTSTEVEVTCSRVNHGEDFERTRALDHWLRDYCPQKSSTERLPDILAFAVVLESRFLVLGGRGRDDLAVRIADLVVGVGVGDDDVSADVHRFDVLVRRHRAHSLKEPPSKVACGDRMTNQKVLLH